MTSRCLFLLLLVLGSFAPSQEGHAQPLPKRLRISARGCAFLITDPLGRRAGIDPSSGVEYKDAGDVDVHSSNWLSIYKEPAEGIVAGWGVLDPIEGWYTIRFGADNLVAYSFSVVFDYGDTTINHLYRAHGIVDAGYSDSYRFRFGLPVSLADSVTKSVSVDIVQQSVFLVDKMGWDVSPALRDSLLAYLDSAKVRQIRGDTQGALGALSGFQFLVSRCDGKLMLTQGADILRRDCGLLTSAMLIGKPQIQVPALYKSIQSALDKAPSGSTILVQSGTYDEFVKFSGKDSISLVGDGAPGSVRLRGLHIEGGMDITIENLALDGQGTARPVVELAGDDAANSGVTIERCEIKGSAKGVPAILIHSGNVHTRIANNSIHSNGGHGIFFQGGSRCHYCINNTIAQNAGSGIVIGAVDTVYLANNVIGFNGFKGDTSLPRYGVTSLWSHDPKSVVLLHNVVVGNLTDMGNPQWLLDAQQPSFDDGNLTTYGNEGVGVTISTGSTFASIFELGGQPFLMLSKNSVARDQGVTWFASPDVALSAVPATDRIGKARGGTYSIDCGCYERPE